MDMNKKRAFIIHGWGGHPEEGWQNWLSQELRKRNFNVIAPQMPNTEVPKIKEWVFHLSDLVGEPDENTFFVGHSIGCQTIMRYLETIFPKKISQVIFVAGWFNLQNLEGSEEERIAKPWIQEKINFEKVKNATQKFTVFLSENDEWVPLSDKDIFENKLSAKVIVQKNKGHFIDIFEMPEILKLIE
jgi:uncharacterized protein